MGVKINSRLLIGVLFISFSPTNSASVSSVDCTDGGNECNNILHSACDITALKCQCEAGYKEDDTDNSICVKAPVSEVVCKDGGTECDGIGHSECDTTKLKCQCEAGYKENATDDSTCVKVFGSVCTGTGECEGDTNTECKSLQCACKTGYKEKNNVCTLITVTETTCSGTAQCQGIEHSECKSGSCACIDGFKEKLNTCEKVIGSQCTGDSVCPGATNSKCENDKCACAANYGVKNEACKLTVSGTVCTDGGVECDKIDNAICDADVGKCKCSPGFTMNIDTCVPENGATTSRHMEATMLAISVLVAIKGIFG